MEWHSVEPLIVRSVRRAGIVAATTVLSSGRNPSGWRDQMTSYRAARVHHAHRRRGGGVVARGASAASDDGGTRDAADMGVEHKHSFETEQRKLRA